MGPKFFKIVPFSLLLIAGIVTSEVAFNTAILLIFGVGMASIFLVIGASLVSLGDDRLLPMKEIMREVIRGIFLRVDPPPKGKLVVDKIQKREGSNFYNVEYHYDTSQPPISDEVASIMIANAPSKSEREQIKKEIELLNTGIDSSENT